MIITNESPDLDTAFFEILELVNGGGSMNNRNNWGNSTTEIKERERSEHTNSDASRERMTKDKPNTKENPNSGTSRIPLWSN